MSREMDSRSIKHIWAWCMAFVVAGSIALTSCGGAAPQPEAQHLFVLVANSSTNRVEVLSAAADPADLARNTTASFAIGAGGSIGAAIFGPDGRIYVSDWSGGKILVYDAGTALGSGNPSPAAVITSPALLEPLTMAFAANGDLWVVDRRGTIPSSPVANRMVKLAGVSSAVGDTVLDAAAILDFRSSTSTIFRYNYLDGLLLDKQGNLWVTDLFDWTVSRIDDPADLTGTHADFVPDQQFASVNFGDGDLSAVRNPASLAMDAVGRLYVGNRGQVSVARFDDPYAITTGDTVVTPSAAIHVAGEAIPNTSMIGFDSSGSLWVASASVLANVPSVIVRLPNPDAAGPVLSITPTARFAWAQNADTHGGSLTFHER